MIYMVMMSYSTPSLSVTGSSVSTSTSAMFELSSYLDSDFEAKFGPDFNIPHGGKYISLFILIFLYLLEML
jgi:hypothetical protein